MKNMTDKPEMLKINQNKIYNCFKKEREKQEENQRNNFRQLDHKITHQQGQFKRELNSFLSNKKMKN